MKLIDYLLTFQKKLAASTSRFLIALWSRQTGKGYTTSFIATRGAMTEDRSKWLIVAPTERQALETLDKCKTWVKAANLSVAESEEEFDALEKDTKVKAKVIELPNGSKIYALPGKPTSLRGFTGSVIIDEFAFFENQKEVWKAVYAVIVNPMASIKRIIITSTPNGKGDMFYKLVDENLLNPKEGRKIKWEVQKVTIHEAAKDWEAAGKLNGMTAEQYVEEVKAGFDTPEAWPQEFECAFLDTDNVLLSFDMITAAESTEAALHGFDETEPGTFYGGFDFGRTSDPSVFWYAKKVGDVLVLRDLLLLENMSTDDQVKATESRVRKCRIVAVDYTGPGIGYGDTVVKKFGAWDPAKHSFGKIVLCTFSAAFKRLIFPRFRKRFENPVTMRIPHDEDLRQDLHAMRQIVTGAEYSYWAPRTSEGHSDRCTAGALCVHAASLGGGYVPPIKPGKSRASIARRLLNALRRRRHKETD